jgi:predicted AAA+ superfamily ATPase
MLGRYHYYRIHPFTLNELGITSQNLKTLFTFGGFPEPLIEQDEIELRRWHQQRVSKLVRFDLRDLENINDLDKVELLADNLHTRVASILSYKSLAEDLEKSDKTIKNWIRILETLYFCFTIPPFGSSKIKAIKKSQKLYLWDWSQVEDEGARFENMVASHLFKLCHYWEDVLGFRAELRYIRDETGKECDFVVLKNRKPVFVIECKIKDKNLDKNLIYFKDRLDIPKWYQVFLEDGEARIISPDLKIISFIDLCREIELV